MFFKIIKYLMAFYSCSYGREAEGCCTKVLSYSVPGRGWNGFLPPQGFRPEAKPEEAS